MLKLLPKYSVEHPVVMIAVFLALVGGGFLTYIHLPVELQPYVDSPSIGVIIQYPGVSAEDMEAYFTRPLEQKLGVLNDKEFIRSNSQEGRAEIIVGFPYFSDINKHKVAVETLVNSVLSELPLDKDNTTNPWVVHVDAQNVPILDLQVTHDAWDDVTLREFVANQMRNRFEQIPGVQSAIPFGGKRRQVTVEVDRTKLEAFNLGLMDIKTALERQHLSRSGGRMINPEQDTVVRLDLRYRNPEEMRDIPIGSSKDRIVYLRDVAAVKDTYAEVRSGYHFNGQPGVLLTIVKVPDKGDPQVIDPALTLAREFEQSNAGLHIRVAYNRNDFMWRIIANSWKELFLAFFLTSIVLLAFLNTITPTVIVLIQLPVIVLASFVLWKPWGLTINTPTNMALVFVLGRLVDDAVVMMDVINRHLKKGKSPKQAAIDGARELTFAVLATGLTFWLVLTPNLFLQGAMGIGFRGMTAPMIFAHMFSAFFALTMNPMMAAYLFKPYRERLANPVDRFFTWLFRPFIWLVEKLEWLYRHALDWSLDHRAVIIGVAVASIYAGWKVWPMLGWEGMPLQDTGQAVGEVEAWPGAPYPETEKIVSRVEAVLMRQPEVKLVSTQIGQEPAFGTYFSGFGVRTVNKAFFKVTMTHKDERVCLFFEKWHWYDRLTGACSHKTGRSVWEIMDAVQREVLQTVPGIRSMWLMEMGATPVNTARNPVEVVFRGDDLGTLAKIGDQAIRVANRAPGVAQPFTNWSLTMPQYRVEVDRARAQELGLAVPQIAMQAFYATQGGMTSEFFKPEGLEGTDRHQRLLIRYRPEQRATREDLENVIIAAPNGKHVRLKEVARVVPKYGTDFVYKEDLQYALAVLGQYRDVGLKMATAGILMGAKTSIPLPRGYTVQPTGMMLTMLDNIYRLYDGLVFAVFFVFIALLLQSGSMVSTLAIMADIPLQLMGAVFALYIGGFFWSPPVLWGQTIAVAMVGATGIFLVDLTDELRKEGMSRREAIVTAGPIRLRPVLMTFMTTAAAFVPPMFAPPTGMDRFTPIAWGLVGAMASSLVLSLLTVPVFYSLLDDLKEFLKALFTTPGPVAVREAVPEGVPAVVGLAVPEGQRTLAGGSNGEVDGPARKPETPTGGNAKRWQA
jgi:HAE1 family hydrophobic/amphiphilic exporter-1